MAICILKVSVYDIIHKRRLGRTLTLTDILLLANLDHHVYTRGCVTTQNSGYIYPHFLHCAHHLIYMRHIQVGDLLMQSSPQNTRMLLCVFHSSLSYVLLFIVCVVLALVHMSCVCIYNSNCMFMLLKHRTA